MDPSNAQLHSVITGLCGDKYSIELATKTVYEKTNGRYNSFFELQATCHNCREVLKSSYYMDWIHLIIYVVNDLQKKHPETCVS